MQMHGDLSEYEHIPEQRIQEMASVSNSPGLLRLLEVAKEWREADCTPVFIVVQEEPTVLACVSEETFGKPYN